MTKNILMIIRRVLKGVNMRVREGDIDETDKISMVTIRLMTIETIKKRMEMRRRHISSGLPSAFT